MTLPGSRLHFLGLCIPGGTLRRMTPLRSLAIGPTLWLRRIPKAQGLSRVPLKKKKTFSAPAEQPRQLALPFTHQSALILSGIPE